MYKYLFCLVAAVLTLGCSPAFAELMTETIAAPEGAPAWVTTVIGIFAASAALVSQVDAQLPEKFKKKFPWWLVLVWNFLAGNYRHSKNKDES